MKKALSGLLVFMLLLWISLDSDGLAKAGYMALGALLYGVGLWLGNRRRSPHRA